MIDKAITKSQTRAIQARRHVMAMDDELYREVLHARYSVSSTRDLTRAQANDFMVYLYNGENKSRTSTQRARSPARSQATKAANAASAAPSAGETTVVRMATLAQRRLIAALASEVCWREEGGYQRWLEKNMGLTRVATSAQAGRVIEGLKGLKRHNHAD